MQLNAGLLQNSSSDKVPYSIWSTYKTVSQEFKNNVESISAKGYVHLNTALTAATASGSASAQPQSLVSRFKNRTPVSRPH